MNGFEVAISDSNRVFVELNIRRCNNSEYKGILFKFDPGADRTSTNRKSKKFAFTRIDDLTERNQMYSYCEVSELHSSTATKDATID